MIPGLKAETIYDVKGFQWVRGRPFMQIALGLLCGLDAAAIGFAVLSLPADSVDYTALFVHPQLPLYASLVFALLMLLTGAAVFMAVLAVLIRIFYDLTGNGLLLVWPWGGRRFRALCLAVFYVWAFETMFHMILYILYISDAGSHVFVVLYAGQDLDFLYAFLLTPWFWKAALGAAYPISEILCYNSGGSRLAAQRARLLNSPPPQSLRRGHEIPK